MTHYANIIFEQYVYYLQTNMSFEELKYALCQ